MNNDQHNFEQFMKQRDEVARAYVNGEAASLGEIVTHHSPATFFGPQGGYRQGAEAVWSVDLRARSKAAIASGRNSALPPRRCYLRRNMALAALPSRLL